MPRSGSNTAASSEVAGNTAGAGDGGSPLPGYLGSKGALNTVRRVLRLFRPHSLYVESFLGGGAVLRFKQPALRTIAIDADDQVIEAWQRAAWPGVELVHADAIAWLEEARTWLPADALVYADPPYPLETRTSRKRYRRELTRADHVRLLNALDALPCSVVVSSYDSELYRDRLREWGHDSWPARTRGRTRIEHAWYKHPSAADTAGLGVDVKGLGENYRDRERIKRKVKRWAGKFERMSATDRVAILSALLAMYGDARGNVAITGASGDEDLAPATEAPELSLTPMLWSDEGGPGLTAESDGGRGPR